MKPVNHGPAVRSALAIGLVAGVWLVLSALTPGPEENMVAGLSSAASEDSRIRLAQADAAPFESPVSYASEQADRGEEDFTKNCVECHGTSGAGCSAGRHCAA